MLAPLPTQPAPLSPSNTIHYRVEPLNLHAHLFSITLTVPQPTAGLVLALPVWIPGSYLVREFAQHLQGMRAWQDGQPVALRQLDKHRWRVDALAPVAQPAPITPGLPYPAPAHTPPLQVQYEVYARDASVRTAWLDAERGFFNGTSLCLRVLGREEHPHQLEVVRPAFPATVHGAPATAATAPVWRVATGLTPWQLDEHGFGVYSASSFDELVDAPVEMGPFWSAQFEVCGIPHRLVVSGAGQWFDGERLLADTQRICETEMTFWHGSDGQPPFSRYVFMLHTTHDGYGGLEHANSTALICPRSDLPRRSQPAQAPKPTPNQTGQTAPTAPAAQPPALTATDGYTRLLGLISHEYFHTWSVKRLRPAELAQIDFDRENHTELLWLFEGFTSYYDDLLLLRAGLLPAPAYLQLLAKTINQVAHTPGRLVQTVAQASFDAWTKFYRVQENTPNATISYYTKGALVALCLDLTLRQHGSSLDHAMRALWQRSSGGPMTEHDLRDVLAQLAGRRLDAELDAWVHSTADLPVRSLLEAHGIRVQTSPAPLAQQLGLRVSETASGLTIQSVLRGGLAEQAGMAAGDEWLAVAFSATDGSQPSETWRIHKLDDVPPLLGTRSQLTAWVSRDRRVLALPLTWPGTFPGQTSHDTVQLSLPAAPAPTDGSHHPTPSTHPTWPAATLG